MKPILITILFLFVVSAVQSQRTSSSVTGKIDKNGKYLFYLHGAIVQDQGVNAVSKDFGPYKYLDILDTFQHHGFFVISEARPKDTEEMDYAEKISRQVDTLLKAGLPAQNIIIVGASQGAYITVEAANKLKNKNIHYVILGLCSEYALNYFSKYKELCGRFLSIYETSDPHGSCNALFSGQSCNPVYNEIKLNMALNHGFLYQPYKEWVQPVVEWIKE